jgi:hypothetical protein
MVTAVYVKTTVRRRGEKEYCYLSLVEAVRVDGKVAHRTLLRLGEVTELRCGCRKPYPAWSGGLFVFVDEAVASVCDGDGRPCPAR